MKKPLNELILATDMEADGPYPGEYSMISIGLAVVGEHTKPGRTFYRELSPISSRFVPEALAVSGLDRNRLLREGTDPLEAMTDLAAWVKELSDEGNRVVYLAGPAGYDGMWVNYYLQRFLGRNPFAPSGACIDMRSYFMGAADVPWNRTGKSEIIKTIGLVDKPPHTHNALDDAIELAVLFDAMRTWRRTHGPAKL